jgi:hypothetical protein
MDVTLQFHKDLTVADSGKNLLQGLAITLSLKAAIRLLLTVKSPCSFGTR